MKYSRYRIGRKPQPGDILGLLYWSIADIELAANRSRAYSRVSIFWSIADIELAANRSLSDGRFWPIVSIADIELAANRSAAGAARLPDRV